MRFSKGSIEVSYAQDIPLLRQVLHSQTITHDQLFEFMRIGCYELKRPSFNWRVRRLVEHGFLNRYYLPEISQNYLYRIGSRATCLSEFATFLAVRSRKQVVEPWTCIHSIELNRIHLSLARLPGVLEKWVSETTIVSQNLLTTFGYSKDYDALVTVRLEHRLSTFALEYERTVKRKADYIDIRERLESEHQVQLFLYLAATEHLLSFLTHCFASVRVGLYLGLAVDFLASPLDTPVVAVAGGRRTLLRNVL
jgi:hypothetical protein